MDPIRIGNSAGKRVARTAIGLLGGVLLLALAGCSGEGEGSASTGVVSPASAQGSAQPTAAPTAPAAPNSTPIPGAAPAPAAATPAPPAPAAGAAEAPAAEGSVDVAALMQPGPLPEVVMGDPNAPVTIVEYASMTCSHCANFHINSLPTLKKEYLDTGKAKLILREFPFDPRSLAAFMLIRCAPEDKREPMMDVLYRQQDQWARAESAAEALLGIAKLAGFTQESFAACLNDKDLQTKIVDVQKRGESEFGVQATPTFFINGNRYPGALMPAELSAIIDSML